MMTMEVSVIIPMSIRPILYINYTSVCRICDRIHPHIV